jgi:hypothetical protein
MDALRKVATRGPGKQKGASVYHGAHIIGPPVHRLGGADPVHVALASAFAAYTLLSAPWVLILSMYTPRYI